MNSARVDLRFPHYWRAEILPARPVILPVRHFTYPSEAEEVERGALEVMVHPVSRKDEKRSGVEPFLATCALGFRDTAVPTGLWSTPRADEICAVCGGYAYLIDTRAPECFTMLPYRPVLEVRPVPEHNLLLFVGHHAILAWGENGEAWQSAKLSDEGVTIANIDVNTLHGLGWNLMTDKETPFTLDLRTGSLIIATL